MSPHQEGTGAEVCEACGTPLLGAEIPGLRGRRSDRRVHIPGTGTYAGYTLVYRCPDPDCGHMWPRFPEEHKLHARGRTIIARVVTQAAHRNRGAHP